MNPYLSVVMGIGGNVTEDLLDRLHASIFAILPKYKELEIVIVEWNLAEPIDYSEVIPVADFPVRIIHTPRYLHERRHNPHGYQYFEMAPKNIGIRRARGEFVLSTNPDGIWSEELAAFFARRELQHGHFYRVNRHDTSEGKVFCICHATGGHSPNDSLEQIRKPSSPRACAWHENMLHFNAAGDFTLMARDDWFMIHGNPEREYNDSVDGETIWLAHTKGLKQVILPYPLYHPDHPRTLNFSEKEKRVKPIDWDDNKPYARMNGDEWGYAGMEFEETII